MAKAAHHRAAGQRQGWIAPLVQTYDRELSGVFAVQEEIAKDVSQALSITLDVGDTRRARGGTTNLEA